MLKTQLQEAAHDLNNALQAVLWYLELNEPDKALASVETAIALARKVGIQACAAVA